MTIIQHLGAGQLGPRKDLFYIDVFKLFSFYERLAFSGSLILHGPKGIGKSLSISAYAAQVDSPIVTFDCSEDVRRSNLIGNYIIQDNTTPFVLGPITTAIEVANQSGSCILLLEEISCLTPAIQKIINPITDFRSKIDVPEADKVFCLDPKAKLWVVGTMNPSNYGGVYSLNEDLKSRFRIKKLGYPSASQEHEILNLTLRKREMSISDKVISGIIRLAFETRQSSFDYALSTRDIIQIIEDTHTAIRSGFDEKEGLEESLQLISGKFDTNDYDTFVKRVSSIFEGIYLEQS